MEYSICSFGVSLFAVFLATQVCDARDLPSAGLLDEMPKNCSDVDFCLEKHVDYPQEKIDELLNKKYKLTLASSDAETGDRVGEGELDQSQTDCEKRSTYGEIFEIIDEHDNVRVVVQSKIFKQIIRIEQCIKKGRLIKEGGTKNFDYEILEDHEIFCDEKTIDHSFLVLTRDGNEVEFVKSKYGIPVCCSCRLH